MPASPRWLEHLAAQRHPGVRRAPLKPPPADGPLRVERWQIPPELRYRDQWAAWHYEQGPTGSWSKPPYNPRTGERAEPSDPQTWSSFDEALEAYLSRATPNSGGRPYDGVSFALAPTGGLVGIDLDHVSEHPREAQIITRALNSYAEYSPSRDGIRLFVRGSLPEGRRRRDWVEMSQRRFLSVTGHRLTDAPTSISASPRLYAVWDQWLNRG